MHTGKPWRGLAIESLRPLTTDFQRRIAAGKLWRMANLQKDMARHGFESNDDYSFQLHCLLNSGSETVRCLNIEGDCGRRKTAFANALAQAMQYPYVLYHDFTQQHPPLPDVILPLLKDEQGREEPPIDAFDQIFSEACAYSEAENTILILDQLQAADFREHIRIYRFLCSAEWTFRDAAYQANRQHLLVFLISEDMLYHSLQKLSFRVWIDHNSVHAQRYRPEDFDLAAEAGPLLDALADLFQQLGATPTRSEYQRLLLDLHHRVRTSEGLRHCIFGWTEGVSREQLYAPASNKACKKVMQALESYLGVDEVVIMGHQSPT
jgi:hypothetical protein